MVDGSEIFLCATKGNPLLPSELADGNMSFGPYTEVMNRCGYYADQVPVIQVQPGDTDYIDLIEEKDMGGHPVVVYTDKFRRQGFALLLEDKVTEQRKGLHCEKGVTNVLAPFQRYTDGSIWSFGWGNSQHRMEYNLQTYWKEKHGEEADSIIWRNDEVQPAFSGPKINQDLLEEIVSGKNPYVGLKMKFK